MAVTKQNLQNDMNYESARQNMVDGQVRTNKVSDLRLIAALRSVPREKFVPQSLQQIAYVDEDMILPSGRFLLEPMVLGRLIQSAEIKPDHRVMDIGCASGYSTAVLAALAQEVVGVEADTSLCAQADQTLSALNIKNASIKQGPFLKGCTEKGPYDVIIINGALDAAPQALMSQLKEGGKLLCIIKAQADRAVYTIGKATLFEKSASLMSGRALFDAASPYIEVINKEEKFVF